MDGDCQARAPFPSSCASFVGIDGLHVGVLRVIVVSIVITVSFRCYRIFPAGRSGCCHIVVLAIGIHIVVALCSVLGARILHVIERRPPRFRQDAVNDGRTATRVDVVGKVSADDGFEILVVILRLVYHLTGEGPLQSILFRETSVRRLIAQCARRWSQLTSIVFVQTSLSWSEIVSRLRTSPTLARFELLRPKTFLTESLPRAFRPRRAPTRVPEDLASGDDPVIRPLRIVCCIRGFKVAYECSYRLSRKARKEAACSLVETCDGPCAWTM